MSQFLLYYKLGIRYILDIYSVEYILFLISLLVVFTIKDWKRVIILLVFFILGYTITISLASYKVINYNQDLIEFLLPLTIFFTSFTNIFKKKDNFRYHGNMRKNYFLALVFGAGSEQWSWGLDAIHDDFKFVLSFRQFEKFRCCVCLFEILYVPFDEDKHFSRLLLSWLLAVWPFREC